MNPRSSDFDLAVPLIFRPERGKALTRENGARHSGGERFQCFNGLEEKIEESEKWESKEGREKMRDRAFLPIFWQDCSPGNWPGTKSAGAIVVGRHVKMSRK